MADPAGEAGGLGQRLRRCAAKCASNVLAIRPKAARKRHKGVLACLLARSFMFIKTRQRGAFSIDPLRIYLRVARVWRILWTYPVRDCRRRQRLNSSFRKEPRASIDG